MPMRKSRRSFCCSLSCCSARAGVALTATANAALNREIPTQIRLRRPCILTLMAHRFECPDVRLYIRGQLGLLLFLVSVADPRSWTEECDALRVGRLASSLDVGHHVVRHGRDLARPQENRRLGWHVSLQVLLGQAATMCS